MVCSDGLWGVLGDERMKQIIADAPSPQIACEQLVDGANAAGGPDNITVILVRFPSD
jgi:serine/threonine protein phosphatase PrpC